MIEWFTWAQIILGLIVGLTCIGFAIARQGPNDLMVGGLALMELVLIAQVVVAIVAPNVGNHPSGSLLEFWMYLGTALVIPPAAIVWALIERSRWASLILAVAAMAIAVMVLRMHTIWVVQLA
ncbi:MAG TPA: hypothetical protein VNQ48_02320 [Microbacteriaceae bacterium]|nr:hypothetical protein [Microbacteriaceae bacterium]